MKTEFDLLCETACDLQIPITKPQLRLLLELWNKPRYVASYYPPAKVLVRDGRAEWDGDNLKITTEGQNLIKQLKL